MKKYLILEQIKFSSFKDTWNVKFSNLDEKKAMQKYVALNTLNDNKDISYHLVNMADFWQDPDDKPLILTDEVKDEQSEMPF